MIEFESDGLQGRKFFNEVTGLFLRWEEESDLTPLQMAQVAAAAINKFCDEPTIEFEADSDLDLGDTHER